MFLSPAQAVEAFDELVRCYHECNSFGGDTAELYINRFMNGHSPHYARSMGTNWAREDAAVANRNLADVCELFVRRYPDAIIVVNELPHDEYESNWQLLRRSELVHRIHVRVFQKEAQHA